MSARLLCDLLTDPSCASTLTPAQWTSVLTIANAERLSGSLAHRLTGLALPISVQSTLDAAFRNAETGRTQALWEVEMARRVLAPLGVPVVLLKGSAFVAAGLYAGQGRLIGDLDILVPRDALDVVEAALLTAGWEWVKPNAYDDMYYRRWMHELPPLMHRERDRMIDVHHTILPLTARPRPDAGALIGGAVCLGGEQDKITVRPELVEGRPFTSTSMPMKGSPSTSSGRTENGEPLPASLLHILSPADMIVHAAAHLIADGDLEGGLRNLWDIDRLVREFSGQDPEFWDILSQRAALHQLTSAVGRALRLAAALYETPLAAPFKPRVTTTDQLFIARLLARNGWGQNTRRPLRFAFYIRSHLLRMPPLMLLRHLWIKARTAK